VTPPDAGPDAVERLLAAVDREARALAERLGDRLQCRRGCHDCCRDGLTVGPAEARILRARVGDALRGQAPHPPGACAFLAADGACRIYAARPYVCRTQGLPLRWFDAGSPPSELRDICPLNEPGAPLVDLPAEDCWLLGPHEAELAALDEADGGARVALRGLCEELCKELCAAT